MFTQIIAFASPEYDELLALRYEILRQPLGLEYHTDEISREYKNIHFACYDHNFSLLGGLLFQDNGDNCCQMRQVAVKTEAQNKGVGKLLVQTFEQYALAQGFKAVFLEARQNAIPFYTQLNYQPEGDIYNKIGIPHQNMHKLLLSNLSNPNV